MQPDKAIASLGSPSLKISGFQIWIHGRQFPNSNDHWDRNWLNVTAHCGAAGASVWASGSIITTMDVERFLTECQRLYDQMTGEASIEPMEPNLRVSLRATDRLGHIKMEVQITPDHMSQNHQFAFEIDQSFLPEIVSQCRKVLEDFPVRT
jgi:hypothetical protein